MSNLSTLPKGDSAWLLRKAIERIMEQVSVLETNIGSSTTGNSANTQIIFNDNGTLRGDAGLVYNKTTDALTVTGLVTAGSATITGDLTVATDRLKVVTGSTAVQIGATTQTQFGTTAWPTSYVAKSGSKVLIGNSGELLLWNEAAAVSGNLSTLFVGAKSGPSATMIAGGAIKAGIENITDFSGFLTLSTQTADATMVERYRIDSTGIATWSNVGGVAGTAMTLNSTGLGVKGTIGTSSGDAVIAFGARGLTIGNSNASVASGSFIDITIATNASGYQGFLSVANTQNSNANVRTQTTFSVFGRGALATFTTIATDNGPTAGASFTVTVPSNGVIRITNTLAVFDTTISAQFFGGTSL